MNPDAPVIFALTAVALVTLTLLVWWALRDDW